MFTMTCAAYSQNAAQHSSSVFLVSMAGASVGAEMRLNVGMSEDETFKCPEVLRIHGVEYPCQGNRVQHHLVGRSVTTRRTS